ncbi:MAG: ZIP family metal transporter [Eubacteriales bacterium]|nr:ZIP family metal transporter [Lachnospiraceae bacterium]MDO5128061.1 ZIP family metal transporter [Eubacteriales bacterium]
MKDIMLAVWIPFIGTMLGSACVLFMKGELNEKVQKTLSGFAAGIMIAASVWSLLIPAIELSQERNYGKFAFVPAAVGFLLGIFFLLLLDILIPHLHINEEEAEGPKVSLKKSTMLILAVTLHNIPEGMAVGVTFAGVLSGESSITLMGAIALAIGIAVQNFPEGAIVSMPICASGTGKGKAFLYGTLTGIVEPIGAIITIILSKYLIGVMSYFLAFAAGAMVYVVVEELIPESAEGEHSNIGTIGFAIGFVIMMILDVALG